MNILDIIFLLILSFLLIRGFFNGIIQEIASIASFVLAFVLANKYYIQLEPFFHSFPNLEPWSQILAYASCFLLVMLAVFIIAVVLKKILRLTALGWLDTLGGGGVGFLKGAFFCSILFLVLTAFLPSDIKLLQESKISPYLARFSSTLVSYVPQKMQQSFEGNSQRVERQWHEQFLGQFFHDSKQENEK